MKTIKEYDMEFTNEGMLTVPMAQRIFKRKTDLFNTMDEIIDFIYKEIKIQNKAEEYLYLLTFTANNAMIGVFPVSKGTANESVFSEKQILQRIVWSGCDRFILFHNHPSQVCTPSANDVKITREILTLSKKLDIMFIDHLIICKEDYYSLEDNNWK